MLYGLTAISVLVMIYSVELTIWLVNYYALNDTNTTKNFLVAFIADHLHNFSHNYKRIIMANSEPISDIKTIGDLITAEQFELFTINVYREFIYLYNSYNGFVEFRDLPIQLSHIKMILMGKFTIDDERLKLSLDYIALCKNEEILKQLTTLYAKYCLAVFYNSLGLEVYEFRIKYGIADDKLYNSNNTDNILKKFIEFYHSIIAKFKQDKEENKKMYFFDESITQTNIQKIHEVYLQLTDNMMISLLYKNYTGDVFKNWLHKIIVDLNKSTGSVNVQYEGDFLFLQSYTLRKSNIEKQTDRGVPEYVIDIPETTPPTISSFVSRIRTTVADTRLGNSEHYEPNTENESILIKAKIEKLNEELTKLKEELTKLKEELTKLKEQNKQGKQKRVTLGLMHKASLTNRLPASRNVKTIKEEDIAIKEEDIAIKEEDIAIKEDDIEIKKADIAKLSSRLKYLNIEKKTITSCYKHHGNTKCYDIHKFIDQLYSMANHAKLFISDISDTTGNKIYDLEEIKYLFRTIYESYSEYILEKKYEILFVLLTLDENTLKRLYDLTADISNTNNLQRAIDIIKRLYQAHNFKYTGDKYTGDKWKQDIRGINRLLRS